MARFSADQIYAFARAAGFDPDQAVTMTAVSLAESGGRSTSHATHGEDSRGLWQINVEANPSYGQRYDLWDPRQNAAAAYEISGHGADMSMWSTTHGGSSAAYVQFRAEAQAAAVAHGDAPGLGVWTGTTAYGDHEAPGHATAADAGGSAPPLPPTATPTSPAPQDIPQADATVPLPASTTGADLGQHGLLLAPPPPPSDPPDSPASHGLALADQTTVDVPAVDHAAPADQLSMAHLAPDHRADAFVDAALAQRGDRYVFGAQVSMSDPHPQAFDCSELVKWSAHQVGVDVPDGSWLQYLDLKRQGLVIPVDEAIHTKGALLFSFSSAPEAGAGRPSHAHVAVSLGDGQTIEARGVAYGVNEFQATSARFQYAAVLPGLTDAGSPHAAAAPVPVDTSVVASGGRILDTDGADAQARLARRLAIDPHHEDTAHATVADSVGLLFQGEDPTAAHTTHDVVDEGLHLAAPEAVPTSADQLAAQDPTHQHGLALFDDHLDPAGHIDLAAEDHIEPAHSLDLLQHNEIHHATAPGAEHDAHHG